MKRGILVFGIIFFASLLLIFNSRAATYETYQPISIPLYQIDVGRILDKYDDGEFQYVRNNNNNNGLFDRKFEAKIAAGDIMGSLYTSSYKTLTYLSNIKYGSNDAYSSYPLLYGYNGKAMISIRTTSTYNNDTDMYGWWTTTSVNCPTLGTTCN